MDKLIVCTMLVMVLILSLGTIKTIGDSNLKENIYVSIIK